MTSALVQPAVRVFGASWCADTRRCRRLLRRLRVPHQYRDVDLDLEALKVALALDGGSRRTPIVEVADRVLVEPDSQVLLAALTKAGMVQASDVVAHGKDLNLGDLDRVARLLVAAAAILGTARAPGVLRFPLRAGALLLGLTAVRGWCPVYDAWHVTSLNGPGDRPDEAERRTWLASSSPPTVWSNQ